MFVYLDRTGRSGPKGFTAVAGYLFDRDGVECFRKLYQENVEPLIPPDKRGRRMFHAAPCFDGDDDFQQLQRPIRECILARMADAILNSVTVGVVVGIEHAEYDAGLLGRYIKVEIGGKRAESLAPFAGTKYSVCLLRCIGGLNAWLTKKQIDGPVDYIMEAGEHPDVEEEATRILSNIAASERLQQKYRLGGYGFRPKGPDTPWLFAADYFAWVWQRNDARIEFPNREHYGDWQAPVLPLIQGKPHLAGYLTEQAINVQALVNSFDGVMKRRDV